jgi:hypothetical protein
MGEIEYAIEESGQGDDDDQIRPAKAPSVVEEASRLAPHALQ